MTPTLTDEIFQALHAHGDTPLKVENADTGEVCWILTSSHMDKLRPLFEEDAMSEEEKRYQLRRFGQRAGWDDPEMDAYDNYDEHRSK